MMEPDLTRRLTLHVGLNGDGFVIGFVGYFFYLLSFFSGWFWSPLHQSPPSISYVLHMQHKIACPQGGGMHHN